jgi:hypothetical protein
MKNVLLAAAAALALAIPGAPATAQAWQEIHLSQPSGRLTTPHHVGNRHSDWSSERREFDGRMRDRRGNGDAAVVQEWYGGEWALYNNRTFDSDSYNDWWHDRPDRAYPRWLSHNQGCERMWFSGDVLHC